ncbi:YegS/Rv2252/BmrU family lipid kinase [Mollicutes bacterium LVI A0039]|nr:YegS/Rv2252/BmrU family lipid kinase [Mollicutes bacterium LVI A0039]
MKTAVIIFNSVKRRSSFLNNMDILIKGLNERDYQTIVRATLSPTDVNDYISMLTNVDLIVGAGGDGTINEIVNSISNNNNIDPYVLFFPTGTVNDFATSLQLKNDVKYGLKLIDNNQYRRIDSARIGERTFFNYVCAFGPFTSASYSVTHTMKRELGALAYVLKGITEVATITNSYHLKANVDGRIIEGDYSFGMIVNSHSVAGMKSMFRATDITDGYYTLFLMKHSAQNIAILPKLIIEGIGKEYIEDGIVCISFKQASIDIDQDVMWSLDGERGPVGGFDVEVVPANVKIYTEL